MTTDSPPPRASMPLPLERGGRPAFGAESWLVSLHYHAQSGLPGAALHANAGVGASCSMHAAAHLLRTTDFDVNQVIDGWKDLPVILSPGFARDWETAKPWRDWRVQDHKITAYQSLIDGSSPSRAYAPDSSAVAKDIWVAALACMPLPITCDMLAYAAATWMRWAHAHPEVQRIQHAIDTLTGLGASLGMGPKQRQTWARLELWWMSLAADMPVFGAYLLQATACRAPNWFGVCAAAIGVHPDEIEALFTPSGPLVSNGLYNPLARENGNLSLPGRDRAIGARLDEWSSQPWAASRRDLVRTTTLSWHDLVQPFAPSDSAKATTRAPVAPVEDAAANAPVVDPTQWAHLQGAFEQSVAALRANPGLRMLIVGAPGTGKTRLCQDMLAAATLPAQSLLAAGTGPGYPDPDAIAARLKCASWACLPTGAALVIDGPENLFDSPAAARFLASATRHPVIVIAEDLARFTSSARTGFDRIIWVEDMPLPQRLALTSRHFTDETLALRVARALRTPKAIIEAARWCRASNSWTWDTVQSHARASDRAAAPATTQTQFEIEPAASLGSLPPMAGNKHLEELANRLCLSFERPQAFAALGAIPPKGAVLLGSPGTGKTLFARHLAARLAAPMIAPDPSMLAKHPDRVGPLFEFARRHAPCVLLLDEAEPLVCMKPLIGPPPALAALLTEIDGAQQLDGVMIIATSNNPNIAPALLRSGRLSEVRTLSVPFDEDRQAIWQAYLADRPLEKPATTEPIHIVLARASRGLTGADIADTLRRAAGEAVAAGETALSLPRLLRACDDVRWGAPDGQDSICPQERRSVAIHEAGHALLAWRHGLEVQRITVRSRTGALGMVQWDHLERRHEQSRAKAFGRLQMTLGGIAAEQALLGEYGEGGSSDLAHAHELLVRALAHHGLGSLGPVAIGKPEYWSDQMRRRIEDEASTWSHAAFTEAVEFLGAHKAMVEHLADCLLAAGDLSGPDLAEHAAAVASVKTPIPAPPPPQPGYLRTADPGAPRMSEPSHAPEPTHRLHVDPALTKDAPLDSPVKPTPLGAAPGE